MRALRAHSIEITLLAILLASIAYFAYLAYGLIGNVVDQPFSGDRSMDYAREVFEFGPRPTGSDANKATREWLVSTLSRYGWEMTIQPFTTTTGLNGAELGGAGTIVGTNVIAIKGPAAQGVPVGMLATHYDTRLVADGDANPASRDRAARGANKGASGVALLVELARTLDVESGGHTLCLVFFDAEENSGLPGWQGQMGSQLFVENLGNSVLRCASPRFAVIVDLVGAEGVVIHPDRLDTPLNLALREIAADIGMEGAFAATPIELPESGKRWFLQNDIPSVSIIDASYPFVNSLSDTVDKLKPESLEQIGRTLEVWLERGADFPN